MGEMTAVKLQKLEYMNECDLAREKSQFYTGKFSKGTETGALELQMKNEVRGLYKSYLRNTSM